MNRHKDNNQGNILLFILICALILGCGGGGGSTDGGLIDTQTDNPGPISAGTVTLQWNSPTTNNDGSPLNDLSGYKVYYGTSSKNYVNSVDVGNQTSASINGLSSGSWFFSVTAYDIAGNESAYSNEVEKSI